MLGRARREGRARTIVRFRAAMNARPVVTCDIGRVFKNFQLAFLIATAVLSGSIVQVNNAAR